MSDEKLVLIFVSAQKMESEAVRALLESSGVNAIVGYDGLMPAGLVAFYTQSVGKFEVFVQPQELDRAVDVVREHIEAVEGPPFYGAYSSLGSSPLVWKEQASIPEQSFDEPLPAKPRKVPGEDTPTASVSRNTFLAIFILIIIVLASIINSR